MQHAGYRASVYIVKVSVLMYIELISLYIYDIFYFYYILIGYISPNFKAKPNPSTEFCRVDISYKKM